MFGANTIAITQEVFRIILDSIAHPGRILSLPESNYDSFSAMLYTLLDHETSFSVIGTDVREEFIDRIYRLTKARYLDIDRAEYIIVSGGSSGGMLAHIKRGDLEFPDRGATIFYRVESLSETGPVRVALAGPGVKDRIGFSIKGADIADLSIINHINSEYPLGIDIVFVDNSMKIASIPRSSRVTIEENSIHTS